MQKMILIYDDDLEILEVCRIILEDRGYLVETFPNCENIIADIESLNPQIILMDLWIPKIGGEKTVDMIHKNSKTKHIPIVLFSANDEIEKIALRINADGYLKKPFDISTFMGTIENLIL